MKSTYLTRLLATLAMLTALPLAAQTQYPTKPVRLMVGYAAGSSTDIIGRIMAERMSVFWKQNVYVESRGGAAGNLAADAVAKATGDGYTLLFAQNGLAISAAAKPDVHGKSIRDDGDVLRHPGEGPLARAHARGGERSVAVPQLARGERVETTGRSCVVATDGSSAAWRSRSGMPGSQRESSIVGRV